jgi:hypothetical protein
MELTSKLINLGKWGLILLVVLEISALVTGSIFMKEKVIKKQEQPASYNITQFDHIQKLKGNY